VIRDLAQYLIRRTRGDSSYTVSVDISTLDLLVILVARGQSLIRAQAKLLGVRGSRLRFVEAGCDIRHRGHLSVGRGSVIEANARLSCLGSTGVRIGDGVTIGKFAIVECTSVLWDLGVGATIGNGSSVGDYSFIGCAGGVTIGSNVLMGQHVSFHSQNHAFDDPGELIRDQGVVAEGIIVEDDCWIGSGSIILDGVTIGRGCVIAAGSVVTTSFGPNTVIAGVPARSVKSR
jgi:acetyltransferase-like isoleucine patch superfamily enzyme